MRKDVLNPKGFKAFNAVSMATNQTSPIIYIPYLDNLGIVVSWENGSSLAGEVVVEVANQQENPNESIIWGELDFGTTISISGASGEHLINCAQLPFNAMRIKYISTSGTGDLTAIVQVKMV